jgi:hypothetical protein
MTSADFTFHDEGSALIPCGVGSMIPLERLDAFNAAAERNGWKVAS